FAVEDPTQVEAVDELHREPRAAGLDAAVVEAHHVHVLDGGEGLAFLAEAGLELRHLRHVLPGQLQDAPRAVGRPDLVDVGDEAGGDVAKDLVVREACAGLEDGHVNLAAAPRLGLPPGATLDGAWIILAMPASGRRRSCPPPAGSPPQKSC